MVISFWSDLRACDYCQEKCHVCEVRVDSLQLSISWEEMQAELRIRRFGHHESLFVCGTETNQPELEIQIAVFILHSRSLNHCHGNVYRRDGKRINRYGYRFHVNRQNPQRSVAILE